MTDSVNDVQQARTRLILELVLVSNVVQVTEPILAKTDVSLVQLANSPMEENVNLVLQERSPPESEPFPANVVLVVTNLLPTAKPVCLVETESLLNLVVLVNLVLQTAIPSGQDHANVLLVVQDQSLMVLRMAVYLAKLVRIHQTQADANCVQQGLFLQQSEPRNVLVVVVVEKLIQAELNVTCVKQDSFLLMKANANIVRHWNTLPTWVLVNV